MTTTKTYFRDHFVLFLLSINVFFALLAAVIIILRVVSVHGGGYIVQYRSSLGISAFKNGNVSSLISFAVFALLILVINALLSNRTYPINRYLSVSILCLGILLTILDIIVSNALLVLH